MSLRLNELKMDSQVGQLVTAMAMYATSNPGLTPRPQLQ